MQNSVKKSRRAMPPTSPEREMRLAEARADAASPIVQRRKLRPPVAKRPTPNHANLSRNQSIPAAAAASAAPAALPHPKKMRKARKEIIKREREILPKFDFPFFTIVIVLLAFGIVTMFSASYAYAFRMHGDSYYYVMRQLGFIGFGIVVMLFLSRIDYHLMMKKFIVRLGAGITLGVMAFVALAGQVQGGAGRWLTISGTMVQPSEVLKFAVIVVLAYWMHTYYGKLGDFKKGFLPILLFLLASSGLTLVQPHLSGAIIIFAIGFIMMFVGDCKIKHIILILLVFAALAGIAIPAMRAMGIEHFDARILSWQNPEADIRGDTFQTYQSLITIGSGGMFGLGLGNSRQKYAYLPASHNDFIFSIICEELGFVGAFLVILLFIMLIARGFYIAVCARDKFGMLMATGITAQLGIQAFLNIGVVTNSIPNTGISLPFFSYGGSALVMQLAGIGVLLNISRKAAIE
jgi:cell division protein FtsW